MTRERAIEYFKFLRKIFCEDHLKICPKDSIAYQSTLKEKEFYDMAITALEQKPQIRPKGHWILTDVEGDRVWHCNCSECGKDPQDYVGGSENWWLIKSKLPKFCPSCASDMREVEDV